MGSQAANAKLAGLNRLRSAQKEDSLRRIRDAAARLFGASGYLEVSVDDIAREAGVTRKTFYRHFSGKAEIAIRLFDAQVARTAEVWAEIAGRDWKDLGVIRAWIDRLIDHFAGRGMSRTFIELGLTDPEMKAHIRNVTPQLTAALAGRIPSFAVQGETALARLRRAQATLLVYQIMDQCSLYDSDMLDIEREVLVEVMARSFHEFVLGE